MMTASSRATTTRIGNSRQNDRFLRPRRAAGLRPPEAVLPSGAASAALSPSAADPLASALAARPRRCWPGRCCWSRRPAGLGRCCWSPPGPGPAPWRPASRRRCPRLTPGPARALPARRSRPGRPLARPPASRHGQRRSSAPLPRPRPLVGVHRHRVELSAKSWPQDRQPASIAARRTSRATARLDHISARYGANAGGASAAGARAPRGPPPRPPPGRRPARPGRPRARRHPRRPRAALPAGRSSGWAGRAVAMAAR